MENDNSLRELFTELRLRDAKRAPSFRQVLHRPRAETDSLPALPWIRWAVAAAVLAGAVWMMRPNEEKPSAPESTNWAAFSNWRAPSDILLASSTVLTADATNSNSDEWIQESTNEPSPTNNPKTL